MFQFPIPYKSHPTAIEYLRKEVLPTAFSVLLPPEDILPSQLADKYRYLPKGNPPGNWDTNRVAYMREPMDCAFHDPRVRKITILKGSRSAGTESMNNVVDYFTEIEPSDILIVPPTLPLAKKYSKDILEELINNTRMKTVMAQDRARDKDNTILHKHFKGGTIYLIGANSAASFRMITARIILKTDLDGYPPSVGGEGFSGDLADTRAETYPFSKLIINESTPTRKGTSNIEKEFLASSQGHYLCKCPYCGHYSRFVFSERSVFVTDPDYMTRRTISISTMKYDHENASWAYFECGKCEKEIHEHQKEETMQNGKYDHIYPERFVHRGFSISQFISSLGSTWRDQVAEFLEARKTRETLQVWVNQKAGEVFEITSEFNFDTAALATRAHPYTEDGRIIIPYGALILVASIDTQDNKFVVLVKAWGMEDENWGILYEEIPGDPASSTTRQKLAEFLDQEFTHESGMPMKIDIEIIDSGGHNTDYVYAFAKKRFSMGRRCYAIKGKAGFELDTVGKERRVKFNAPFFILGVDKIKEIILSRLSIENEGPMHAHYNQNFDSAYFEGLTKSEQLKKVQNPRTGQITRYWKRNTKIKNEPLDCEVYNYAGKEKLNPDWNMLKKRLSKRIEKFEATPKSERGDSLIRKKSKPQTGNWVTQGKKYKI